MPQEISLIVDGMPDRVPAGTTLAELIDRHQSWHKDLIVELNGRFINPDNYTSTCPEDGSKVEMILPAFGG